MTISVDQTGIASLPYPLGLGAPDYEALAYPTELLVDARSCLLLFASGRGGAADGRWVAQDDIPQVTYVDHDPKTLWKMRDQAPAHWEPVLRDCWTYARETVRKWDHVSADPPSQLAPILVESIPTWLAMASRSATLTLYRHCFTGAPSLDAPELANPPAGWRYLSLIHRGDFRGGIYWLAAEHL